jgi:hypothetical protein
MTDVKSYLGSGKPAATRVQDGPLPPGGAVAERGPEIRVFLEHQKNCIEELFSRVMQLEERLGPILSPHKTEAEAEERSPAYTSIGGIISENNLLLVTMIGKLSTITKRVEL